MTEFVCSQCGARFALQSELNEHDEKIHAAMSKFMCTKCDMPFSSAEELEAHNKRMHQV